MQQANGPPEREGRLAFRERVLRFRFEPLYLVGAGVNPSRLRPGSGFGLGFGAFLASFLPLSLLPMQASLPQLGIHGKGNSIAAIDSAASKPWRKAKSAARLGHSKGFSRNRLFRDRRLHILLLRVGCRRGCSEVLRQPIDPAFAHVGRAKGIAGEVAWNRIGKELGRNAVVEQGTEQFIRVCNRNARVACVVENERGRLDVFGEGDGRRLLTERLK